MAFYRPISSQGFRFTEDYTERLPCAPLRPYIHCFWGTSGTRPKLSDAGLVIPDTCMDIIFDINYTRNTIAAYFCALDDAAYHTSVDTSGDMCATFGIRFFAWTTIAFSQDTLCDSRVSVFHPEAFFSPIYRAVVPRLFDLDTLEKRSKFTEEILLNCIKPERISSDIMNALDAIVIGRGTLPVSDVAQSVCLSERQLERLMRRDIGAAPKLMTQLIRHQMIYRDILEGKYTSSDAVEKYGYSDQSHLIRDFRRFHLLSPSEVLGGLTQ